MTGAEARVSLRDELGKLDLGEIWVKLDAFEPNIFFALQPGARSRNLTESYLTVQQHSLDGKKVLELRRRLETGVRPGETFGEWTIGQATSKDGCFELVLENRREVQQEWCFGKSAAVVVTEFGPSRIDDKMRRTLHRLVKEGAR